jgi:hypothetical protein
MGHRPKRSPNSKSIGAKKEQNNAPLLLLDQQLDRILSRLADLVLRHGYGYQRISKLTKAAYVRAAQRIGKQKHKKTSIARIAALTGLTRIEVSKLLKADRSAEAAPDSDLNRATRVAYGWVSNPGFSDSQRRPQPLAFSGRRGFSQLVRKYSGDIPARAMLLEMERLGMVKRGPGDVVVLIRQKPVPARSTIDAIRAIAPWMDLLVKPIESFETADLTSTTQQLQIFFESQSQVLATLRELENRRRSFVSSIEHLGTIRQTTSNFQLTVSIAVAAAQPRKNRRRPQLGDKRSHEG